MKKTNKHIWYPPYISTVKNEELKRTIIMSACSKHSSGCWPSNQHIDSIPGKPPFEIM